MALDPRPWLLEHWPIKLAALALAVVVWIFVAARQPATQLRPVDVVIELPAGQALTQSIPNVSALVSGRVHELIDLYRTPLRIHKAVLDTSTSGSVTIPLSASDIILPQDMAGAILDVQPREISITLDPIIRRRIGVRPRVSIQPDSGFVLLGGVTVIPSEVEVSGPRGVVETVTEVPTTAVNIVNARAPFEQAVPLDVRDLETALVNPREVTIRADIAALAERSFEDIAIEVGRSRLVPAIAVVTLVVRGPAPRLQRFTSDSFSVSANIPNDAVAGDSVSLFAIGPHGITATPIPGTVRLRQRTP